MKRYMQTVAIIVVTALLSGCHLIHQNSQSTPPKQDDPVVVVEQPPKIIATDWQTILLPLIDELLQTTDVSENNTLLLSDIKNRSNQYISKVKVNSIIFNAFNQQTIFNVIDKKTVNLAKQSLGLPYDDSLISRSKMIALARQIKADYVLFTTINQVPTSPDIQANVSIELLLAKTGEIVWQFSSDQLANNQSEN